MDANGPSDPPGGGTTMLRGVTPRTYLDLLRVRGFRLLTLSTLTSTVGDWMGFFAIITLTATILQDRGNTALFAVSGVMVARVLPALLLGAVAGVLVDRWDRKRVMIATDIGRAAVMAMIPFTDEILTLVLATLVIEVMSSLFAPAKDAVFPTLVQRRQLVLANQVNLLSTYGTLPIGALSNAALVAVAVMVAPAGSFLAERPIALPLWVNAASYVVSALFLIPLKVSASARRGTAQRSAYEDERPPSPWQQLLEGFRFITGQPVIRALIVGVMVAAAAAGVVISVGEFFARILNGGQAGFGVLVGLVGVGLVVGLALSAPLSSRLQPERLFAPGIGIAGGALMVIALMPSLAWVAAPALVMGAGAGLAFIIGYTVLQSRSSDAIRGRTFAAFNSGVRVALFSATVAVPFLVGLIGREPRRRMPTPDGTLEFAYPYAIGGIRTSLLLAGLLCLVGSVLTGRALHRGLTAEPDALSLGGEAAALVRHGVFVAFEGGDGAGKSTQIRLLRSAVERAGWDAVVTREPGGTPLGEAIREVLLSPTSDAMGDRTEALLYAAARAQHVDEVIRPALEKGAVVLCDRYVDSSIVYQGHGRQLGQRAVADLNAWATGDLRPDLVVLLDVDPAEGLRRATQHGGGPDRLEAAGLEFHRAVATAYRRLAEADPDRYLVLDAQRPVEQLHRVVREAVLARLAERDEAADGGTRPPPTDPPQDPAASAALARELVDPPNEDEDRP
ncbi:dTMP kinase [Nitriliruptor alkaliphilus]|uniref:dTMP kinase n=1 Tax=Nitriliruptor alkaliphilus TaxID=427918 RepID=UPI000698A926|nr:dTMP kinase [Nitriliruptor alkaliphilus]